MEINSNFIDNINNSRIIYQDFYLIKDNIVYKIIIENDKNEIIIK